MTEQEAFDCGAYAAHSWMAAIPGSDPDAKSAWVRGWAAYFEMTDEQKAELLARKGAAR